MNKLTTIKRHNIFVVGVSLLIAASFWIIPSRGNRDIIFSYKIFSSNGGWGYDILVNDSVKIHQDFIPATAEKKAFPGEAQAIAAAELVIKKLKTGSNPSISPEELQTILAKTNEYGSQRKHQ